MPTRLRALLVACALALCGCARPTRDERRVEPESRRPYRLVVPDGAQSGGRPVLFALHAYATAPEQLVDAYALVLLARAHGFVLVVPEGLRDAHGQPHWNASPACCGAGPRHDDLAYLRAVLRDVARQTPVDLTRVAAIGVSNGAFMAQRWASAAEGELRALVSLCGAYAGTDPPAPGKPVSVLHVHGTHDAVVRYAGGDMGGAPHPGAEATVAFWRRRNGCPDAPRETRRYTAFFEPVAIRTWTCDAAIVNLWTVEGGDHRLRAMRLYAAEFVAFLAKALDGSAR